MTTRAPSCARRTAMPRPMPRLPPVISATRLRRDIPLLKRRSWKACQYSAVFAGAAARPECLQRVALVKAGDDYRHVVSLFGGAGPFFGGGHERLSYRLGRAVLHGHRGLLQTTNSEFFAVDIFRLDQTVAVAHQERIGRHDHRAFLVAVVLDDTEDHAAFVEMQRGILGNEERGKMTGVGVAQITRGAVVHGN